MSVKVGIVGAAGFAGIELARIILRHPEFELVAATSDALEGELLSSVYPGFTGVTDLAFSAHGGEALGECDVVFLAVPHTGALALAPQLISEGKTVVDLSADFRLKDPDVYEAWYRVEHTQRELLAQAAFGLPELTGDELAIAARRRSEGEAVLVACAGCYPTATSLAAAPALRNGLASEDGVIVVDAVSGVTGAGKKANERTHFCFADENVEAYGVGTHRHTPEIEQILDAKNRLLFTPHLAPYKRGLLSTVKIPLDASKPLPSVEYLLEMYAEFYAASPFVQVLPQGVFPKTSSVVGTNNAHIGLAVHEPTHTLIAVGAIDNLCKGAAGQAVQCANIVCGFSQESGLTSIAVPM